MEAAKEIGGGTDKIGFEDNIAPMAGVIASYDGEWLLEKIRGGSKRWTVRHMSLLSACEFEPLPGAS
jgi:hypothetical protein